MSPFLAIFIFLAFIQFSCNKDREVSYPNPTIQKPEIPYYFSQMYAEPFDNASTKEGVALGKALFFDKSLSRDNSISCATCHNPELGFSDGLPRSIGINSQIGRRNSIGLWNVGLQKKFFWDG
jgi:cytochrome c peroxidase